VALVTLVASVPLLTRFGWRHALNAKGEVSAASQSDRSAPGYRAVVSPTPTMLVVHRGPEGQLAGVTMLAGAGDSGGGAVLLVPTTLVADSDTEQPRTLAAIYTSGGVSELSSALGRLFRIGFQSVVTADPRDWAEAAGERLLTVDNPDELVGADGETVFSSGPIEVSGEQVEPYLRLRRDGEDERGRLYRARLLWTAWLEAVAAEGPPAVPDDAAGRDAPDETDQAAGEVVATVPTADTTLGSMIATLGRGSFEVLELPVQPADEATMAQVDASSTTLVPEDGGGTEASNTEDTRTTLFTVDLEEVRALVASIVPFPASAQPGDRVRVRLLDGLGDAGQALNVATLLVPAGAEISVFGNADRFDYSQSVVEYYDPAQRANAEVMASVLGLASATYNSSGDTSVDVNVIVGRDLAQPDAAPKLTIPSRPGSASN
jgi:hypothetical protein